MKPLLFFEISVILTSSQCKTSQILETWVTFFSSNKYVESRSIFVLKHAQGLLRKLSSVVQWTGKCTYEIITFVSSKLVGNRTPCSFRNKACNNLYSTRFRDRQSSSSKMQFRIQIRWRRQFVIELQVIPHLDIRSSVSFFPLNQNFDFK